MLDVETWAEVRRLHRAEGLGVKTIARRLHVARNTVRAAVRGPEPPRYHRRPRGSAVDRLEPELRRWLATEPTMPATVIAERIGCTHGLTILKARVAELRPLYRPADLSQRTGYAPRELAQWDLWSPAVDIPLGWDQVGHPPVLVGALGYPGW